MKDTLRQPDGKIRTACKFCRQRKKRCSGEMPCASCVNFNRECCVYDRWVPSSSSPSSKRPKQEATTINATRTFSWTDANTSTIQPTSPCFTSKVLLTKVHQQHNYPVAHQPSLLLQAPFVPQSYTPLDNSELIHSFSASSSFTSPWSTFDSPMSLHSTPLSPAETMMRTVSLPNFLDQSPVLDASPSSQSLVPMDTLTQSSISSPSSQSEFQSGLPSPSSFSTTTPKTEIQSYSQLLYSQGEKETQDLLQNVDALLMHLGNP